MTTLFLLAIGLIGLYMLRRSTPKQRILVLLILGIAFVMLSCGDTNNTWGTHESNDVTGIVWRELSK